MDVVASWIEVGERVRAARSASELTQSELAQRIGIDRTALVRIETGDRGLSALELGRLAATLSIPVAHFVSRSPGPVIAYRAAVGDLPGASDQAADRTRFLLDVELESHARDAEWLREVGLLSPVDPLTVPPVSSREEAQALARSAREALGLGAQPLGSASTVAEKFGLYVKVVARSTTGASLQLEPGFGVAVVGGESDPGRRRATAVHELGHHLMGDRYNSDAGVAASERSREQLIDSFASEMLLPDAVVRAIGAPRSFEAARTSLIDLSGRYRLSWSATVVAARQAEVVDADLARRLIGSAPVKGDFIAVLGSEPGHDLAVGSRGPRWRRAALAAWIDGRITADRTIDLLGGLISVEDLPARHLGDEV